MEDFKIEKNIQTPRRKYQSRKNYPFDKLEIGDSFFVPETRTSKRSIAAYSSLMGKLLNKRFITKTQENGVRIWRIE